MLHHFLSGEGRHFCSLHLSKPSFSEWKSDMIGWCFWSGAELNVTADEETVAGQTEYWFCKGNLWNKFSLKCIPRNGSLTYLPLTVNYSASRWIVVFCSVWVDAAFPPCESTPFPTEWLWLVCGRSVVSLFRANLKNERESSVVSYKQCFQVGLCGLCLREVNVLSIVEWL